MWYIRIMLLIVCLHSLPNLKVLTDTAQWCQFHVRSCPTFVLLSLCFIWAYLYRITTYFFSLHMYEIYPSTITLLCFLFAEFNTICRWQHKNQKTQASAERDKEGTFEIAKSSINFQLKSLPLLKKLTCDNAYTFILLQKLGTLASALWVFLCLGLSAKKTKLSRSSTVFLLLICLCVSINPSKAQDYYDYVEEVTDGKIDFQYLSLTLYKICFCLHCFVWLYLPTKRCCFFFCSSLLSITIFLPIAPFLLPRSYSFHCFFFFFFFF